MRWSLVVLFLSLFSGIAFSLEDNSVRVNVSGSALAPGGVQYVSVEAVGTDGKGFDWRLLKEVVNPDTGAVSTELVFRSGERQMFGYPLNAFWSVSAGKVFLRVIPATDEHPAWVESQVAVVFVCSGWGGGKPGSANGVCEYLPVSNDVKGIMSDADTATYVVPGGNSAQVFRIGNFRSPTVGERDQYGTFGIVFAYADCSDGVKMTRCFVGIGSQQNSEPRVVFLDGTDGWALKLIEIDRAMVVEELPRAAGWSTQLKVVKGGVERTATATVLPNGESVFHVLENPWIQ